MSLKHKLTMLPTKGVRETISGLRRNCFVLGKYKNGMAYRACTDAKGQVLLVTFPDNMAIRTVKIELDKYANMEACVGIDVKVITDRCSDIEHGSIVYNTVANYTFTYNTGTGGADVRTQTGSIKAVTRVSIDGVPYDTIPEAMRRTGLSKSTILKRLIDPLRLDVVYT